MGLVQNHPSIDTSHILDRSYDRLNDDAVLNIVEELPLTTKVSELNLSGCWLSPVSAKLLFTTLATNQSIKQLKLNHNNFDEESFELIGSMLRVNTVLESLSLGFNHMGDLFAISLGSALASNSTLKTLKIPLNSIGGMGTSIIAIGLQKNSTLTELDLDGNFIGDDAAAFLVESLSSNPSLSTLSLTCCEITKQGLDLFKALRSNTTITSLNLCNSELNDAAAGDIAAALLENTTLTSLNLAMNPFTNTSISKIIKSLHLNPTITHLGVIPIITPIGIPGPINVDLKSSITAITERNRENAIRWNQPLFLKLFEALDQLESPCEIEEID